MKYIEKPEPPEEYVNWIATFKRDNRKSPEYSNIPQKYKQLFLKNINSR